MRFLSATKSTTKKLIRTIPYFKNKYQEQSAHQLASYFSDALTCLYDNTQWETLTLEIATKEDMTVNITKLLILNSNYRKHCRLDIVEMLDTFQKSDLSTRDKYLTKTLPASVKHEDALPFIDLMFSKISTEVARNTANNVKNL